MARIAAALALIICTTASPAWAGAAITLLTEENRPFSWAEPDGSLHGSNVDHVRELMRRTGLSYEMRLEPWPRVYSQLSERPNTCAFTVAVTASRKPLFKWVGPLGFSEIWLYALESSALKLSSIDDVRRQELVIGVNNGDVTELTLEALGGLKTEGVSNRWLNARKLAAGRIDLWADGPGSAEFALKAENVRVKPMLKVATDEIAIACNKASDPASVERMQHVLDAMHKDGSLPITQDKQD